MKLQVKIRTNWSTKDSENYDIFGFLLEGYDRFEWVRRSEFYELLGSGNYCLREVNTFDDLGKGGKTEKYKQGEAESKEYILCGVKCFKTPYPTCDENGNFLMENEFSYSRCR